MTVKETIEMYKGKYDLVEIYVSDGLHTDTCESYEPEQGLDCDYKAESWALMNCEDEKILCILISRETIAMGEEKGREAVKELNMEKKNYYIEFIGTSGDGYVSLDNDSCNSLDMAMTFDTEKEAIAECEKLQKEWNSKLSVACCSEN